MMVLHVRIEMRRPQGQDTNSLTPLFNKNKNEVYKNIDIYPHYTGDGGCSAWTDYGLVV